MGQLAAGAVRSRAGDESGIAESGEGQGRHGWLSTETTLGVSRDAHVTRAPVVRTALRGT